MAWQRPYPPTDISPISDSIASVESYRVTHAAMGKDMVPMSMHFGVRAHDYDLPTWVKHSSIDQRKRWGTMEDLNTSIIYAAIDELFEKGVLELPPDEMPVEALKDLMQKASVTPYEHRYGIHLVQLCDWNVYIWKLDDKWSVFDAWSRATDVCADCGGRHCMSDLKAVGDRLLCSYCILKCEQCKRIPRDQKLHQIGDLRLCGECIVPDSILQAIYNVVC